MNPLVRAAAQDERVLLPDTTAGQIKACILKCFPEVKSLRICVPDVDAAVISEVGMHAAISGQEEVVEVRIVHVVVHDLAGGLLHVHVIRRVRKNQVCLLSVHESSVYFLAGGVSADHSVRTKAPQITQLREHRVLQLPFHIEVIFLHVLRVHLIKERLDFWRIKAGLPQVKVRLLDVFQKIRQQVLIPGAGDLVERNVERLFAGLVNIHHRTGHLGKAQVHRHSESLVAADDCHVSIHDQRISKAELLDRSLDLLVLLVARFQFLPGVILSRFQNGDRQHL